MRLRGRFAFAPRSRENCDTPTRPLGGTELLEMEAPPTPLWAPRQCRHETRRLGGVGDAYHWTFQSTDATVHPGPPMPSTIRPLHLLFAFVIASAVGCGKSETPRVPRPAVPPTGAAEAQGSDVAGWIEVVATRADGTPATGATAYAVRVGRASQTVMPDWPQAEVDSNGVARVPVPDPGPYDVGVVFPSKAEPRVLVADVRVEAGATRRIEARPPALVPVEVSIEGDEPARFGIYASEAGEPGSRASYYPGRGEVSDTRWSFGANLAAVRLPAGVPYEVFIQEQDATGRWMGMMEGWIAEPAVVRAPGHVVFRRDLPATPDIEVPLRFRVVGTVPSGLRRSDLRICYAEGTPEATDWSSAIEWTEGVPDHAPLAIPGGSTPAKLTWSGDGVAPGEILLPSAQEAGAAIRPIEITIHADELPLVEGIDVECACEPPRQDSPFLHVTGPGQESGEAFGFYTWNEDRLVDLRPGWQAVAEWGAWWVSRPVTVPRRGRMKFTLEPGGYLLATSPRVPTPGLGTLTIRRADGAWLGERATHEIEGDDCDGETAWAARPGMILGPLPAGAVELIVSLGGEERTRIRAHVKANAITPFHLTW